MYHDKRAETERVTATLALEDMVSGFAAALAKQAKWLNTLYGLTLDQFHDLPVIDQEPIKRAWAAYAALMEA